MRELRVAKSAGFCFGVSRSVKMAEEMLAAEANCYSLGELIHNDDVVQHLRSEGLTVADGPEQIPQGASVIIRSHGVSRAEFEAVQRTGATVYDATCPKVKRIHEIVAEASAEGRQPVIIGAADHPEVRAICGWCTSPIVVNDASQLAARIADGTIDCAKPLTVVIQTTQTQEKLLECQKIIKKECTNAKLFDTICGATFTRQTEAAQMARNCDAMVVVGGSHSANSRHLYEICCSACANVQFIENAAQLDTSAFVHADTVGLTAGASVPAWIIKEVKQKMSDEILTQENPMETENFDEMLEASLKPIYNGEKVTGTVVAISATEISVDIGTKYSGFIPTSEFTDDGIKVEDVLHVGDSIEASVVRVNDVEGTAMLSKKRLDAVKNWAAIEEAQESGEIVLSRVVVPQTIVVHDGVPTNASAKDYYVSYRDYIKNVASSEIYATWPRSTIVANVLAIMSFTLNRVYTEWYRNQGYDFTITSSTAFDHKWIYGRDIFEPISEVVDDIFDNYLSRPGVRQPILTQYCDGRRVSCPGWMTQWGSQALGQQGYSTIEILRYYYGESIYINTAVEIAGVPSSWPGYTLEQGSQGPKVRQIQEQLNVIAGAYPEIPKLEEDGIYGPETEAAVRKFQSIFGLPVTGEIDYKTWYKISEIYVGVSRIAELS